MNRELLSNPTGHNMNVMAERLNHIIDKLDIDNINVVMDIGSLDAWESINLSRVFDNSIVHTFEPVLFNYNACIENVRNHPEVSHRINLHNIAMNDKTGDMTFWELDAEEALKVKGKLNRGIGSKYQLMNPDMWPWEHNKQRPVTVSGYRLEDWCATNNVPKVDGIWMDVQGAELDVLRGANTVLSNVQFIITEAGIKPYYHGHTMKNDMDAYLKHHGFIEYSPATRQAHEYEVDMIYLNVNLVKGI